MATHVRIRLYTTASKMLEESNSLHIRLRICRHSKSSVLQARHLEARDLSLTIQLPRAQHQGITSTMLAALMTPSPSSRVTMMLETRRTRIRITDDTSNQPASALDNSRKHTQAPQILSMFCDSHCNKVMSIYRIHSCLPLPAGMGLSLLPPHSCALIVHRLNPASHRNFVLP